MLKVTPDWNGPPSRLYSRPAPVGAVTVTDALPAPSEQSVDSTGTAGAGLTVTAVAAEIGLWQPAAFVTCTVKLPEVVTLIICVVAPFDHK